MNLFPGLKLNVYWNTDETTAISNIDENAEIPLSKYTIKEHTFYSIDFIRENCPISSSIGSGGYTFIINEPKSIIEAKIEEVLIKSNYLNIN